MLEDAERTTIGSYGVSGIAMGLWHGTTPVEHVSCHATIDALASKIPSTINTWQLVECLESHSH